MPSIVQFIHPGPEHGHDVGNKNLKSWNHKKHKRKFLQSNGFYITEGITEPKPEVLMFWGEWEPPTDVSGKLSMPNRFYPKWLHSRRNPVTIPLNFGGLQNTDPFVFDGPFRYFLCHQCQNMEPTDLANLDNGSLILFGSNGSDNGTDFFKLDTVFVVRTSVPYDVSQNNHTLFLNHSTQDYYDTAYLRAFPNLHFYPLQLRLYEGATFNSQIHGMYSFVPSKIKGTSKIGFPRVTLISNNFVNEFQSHVANQLSVGNDINPNGNFITDKLNINFKETPNVDIQIIRAVWEKIVNISRSAPNLCVEGLEFN